MCAQLNIKFNIINKQDPARNSWGSLYFVVIFNKDFIHCAYRKVEVVVETSGGFYRRSCVGVTPAASLGVWDVWVDTMSPIRRRGKTDTVMEKDVGKFLTDEVSGVYLVAPDENNEFVKEALEKARNVESSVEVAAKVLASSDHPGHSEDRALAQELCGGKGGAAAVFDGTGSGGLVSAQAAEVCSKTLGEKVSGVTKLPTAAEAAHLLKTTLIESGAKVRELQKKPGGALADTTATIGLVCKGAKDGELGLATANVGDSRMYVYRPGIGRIVQVTKDDSLVALMAERGEITDEEAHTHPDRNIITKAVGDIKSGGDVKVSIIPVKPGDVCFAVSDGISDNFTPSGLEVAVPEAFRNSFDPETRRVDLKAFSGSLATRAFSISQSPTALQAKPDDISIAVLRVPRS